MRGFLTGLRGGNVEFSENRQPWSMIMPTPLDMQRTYAFVGTGGCGKTPIAEMLLFNAGAINRMGAIEEGTTCLDYEPEEI